MQIDEDIINGVINASVGGGVSTSYVVHCTAERVVLFFGVMPQAHRDALVSLMQEQTNDAWISDFEIAAMVGAKMAIGLPELLQRFRARLENESSKI